MIIGLSGVFKEGGQLVDTGLRDCIEYPSVEIVDAIEINDHNYRISADIADIVAVIVAMSLTGCLCTPCEDQQQGKKWQQ